DGEQYRGDMATYFAENIDGTEISGLVRSYGNRYYKKPIIVDELRRKGPISVDWFKFAQARTKRPVKGMITGPYTMMDWSYDEFFEFFNKLPVDQLDLEMSNSGLDLLDRFKREPLKKEIAFGVVDVHSHVIEPESLIRERIEKALTIFEPEKLYIDPDCGLKT